MKIVVTGSLGNISKPLTKELVAKGHLVTVISSKPERQTEIESIGAKAAIGSIDDTEFLSSTFKGADIVYLMEPPFHFTDPNADTLSLWINIAHCYVKAILQSGVTKVIHLSSIGAHTDKGIGLLAAHYDVEKILRELPDNIAIKFIRPVGFYGNLLANTRIIKSTSKGFVGVLMAFRFYGLSGLLSGKRGVIVSNFGGEDKTLLVSPLDIAGTIAEEMEKTFAGRTVHYIASEELTCNEVAKVLGEAIGKPYLKWGIIPDKQLQAALLKMGMKEKMANGIVEMNASIHTGKLYEDYNRNKPSLGKTKLKEFTIEFAKVYNQ